MKNVSEFVNDQNKFSDLTLKEMKKILIVDDDESMTAYIENILGHGGEYYDILSSQDECEILKSQGLSNYDLIIVDVNLIHINGFEFSQLLRRRTMFETPIIFISSDKKNLKGLYQNDIRNAYFLPKPFSKSLLNQIVASALIVKK